MRYGVHTFLWTGAFGEAHLPLVPRIRAMGFDGIEVALDGFDTLPVAGLAGALSATGLQCTLCLGLPQGLSLLGDDGTVRDKAIALLRQAITTAARLGATTVSGPFYLPVGVFSGRRRTGAEWQRGVQAVRAVLDLLDAHGITLAIEPLNRYQTYFLNTTADGVAFCQQVDHPRVGLLLDVFHSNIEDKNVAAAIRLAGPHLKHLHVCENDRGTPGSGHLDWDGIFAALRAVGYAQWMVIESFNFNDPLLAAHLRVWRDLASTPEAIAADGLRFLKARGRPGAPGGGAAA